MEDCFARIHPEDRKRVQEEVAGSLRDGAPYDTEFRALWPDGSLHWLTCKASVFFAESGEPQRMIGAMLDVSKQKRAEEEIRHLAYHDALTGLPNRSLLMDRLDVTLAQAKRQRQMVAVMFLDLDRFKVVNDTAGHLEGDALLRLVGAELTELVREDDTVARIGGDEFVLLLPAVERSGSALEVAQRILESFRQPRLMGGHEFHITASIGVATFPAASASAGALLANADIAMYHAKQEGRDNCQPFTQELGATIVQRLALENDLRHGIDRGEFLVHYQPQVDVNAGRITGTEALVRWQHPQRGLVMPQEFLTIAEETGLILLLGDWILRAACAQTRAWQAATNLPLTVSVNLSARQFQQRDLAERVRQILLQTGLDAASLQLEITESVAIHDVDYTIALLHNLRATGVRIAIDDFGTGHSALSYLRRLPIDIVKIDRSFIRDLAGNKKDPELVTTIISMAHALKLGVIAEGVETEAQAGLLRLMLCDELQGALFSMPVPPDELMRLIRDPANARVA